MSADSGYISVKFDKAIADDFVKPFVARLQSQEWISEENPAKGV
jgi:hypothetical protein